MTKIIVSKPIREGGVLMFSEKRLGVLGVLEFRDHSKGSVEVLYEPRTSDIVECCVRYRIDPYPLLDMIRQCVDDRPVHTVIVDVETLRNKQILDAMAAEGN